MIQPPSLDLAVVGNSNIAALAGLCRIRVRVRPRMDYGRHRATAVPGSNHIRYVTEAPHDFGAPAVAFTICAFGYVDALAAIGRRDEARRTFEELPARRNHVGLLSEDIAPATGELRGNFPKTCSMVGIIVAAMRLSKAWERAR